MKNFTALIVLLLWLAGIAVAKGFWSTMISIVFAPYALYLLEEKLVNLLPR